MKIVIAPTLSISVAIFLLADSAPSQTTQNLLSRHYQEGEKLAYRMKATNQDRLRTIRYEALASGVVKKGNDDKFFEEYAWSDLAVNGSAVSLPAASVNLRQQLSLDPGYKLSVPNLGQVHPMLIGPITDMLTFYSDMQTAIRAKTQLNHAGDHFYFKYGAPNSWADGTYVMTGADSIDFDITLKEINLSNQTAVVVVRHVPPAQPAITFPAEWMRAPVADTPNNWVQVMKNGDKYIASVGKETFDVEIKTSLVSGKIFSATLDNTVDILEHECTDAALTHYGDSIHYQVKRHIEIVEDQPVH
jgi:hypothetical protein